jgi:hypothetical protein
MQTRRWEKHGNVDPFDVHCFELRFGVKALLTGEIDNVVASIVAFTADHADIVRERRTVLARLFAVN